MRGSVNLVAQGQILSFGQYSSSIKYPSYPLEKFDLVKEKYIFNMETHMCIKGVGN